MPLFNRRLYKGGRLFSYQLNFVMQDQDMEQKVDILARDKVGPVHGHKECGSFLLRHFLQRDLSRLLIVIVLFLSPLTFSTEKIPNFQPDCATSISAQAPASAICTVAMIRSENSPAVVWATNRVDPSCLVCLPAYPLRLFIANVTSAPRFHLLFLK